MSEDMLMKALQASKEGGASEEPQEDTAIQDTAREAWDAVKGDKYEDFAEALKNLASIISSSR